MQVKSTFNLHKEGRESGKAEAHKNTLKLTEEELKANSSMTQTSISATKPANAQEARATTSADIPAGGRSKSAA